jgi:hypothetical protein
VNARQRHVVCSQGRTGQCSVWTAALACIYVSSHCLAQVLERREGLLVVFVVCVGVGGGKREMVLHRTG